MGDPGAERLAMNEASVRELNARLAAYDTESGYATLPLDFVCECADDECHVHIEMTAQSWQRAHVDPTTFVIAPHHDAAGEIEEVVQRNKAYWVVRKVGEAGRVAAEEAEGA
jgi:hypothetical protein